MSYVAFRRKREGKTNYNRRLQLLVSQKPRFVIRKFLSAIQVQLVTYSPDGDVVVVSAHSRELKKYDVTPNANLPTAYLTGLLCGLKAKAKGHTEGIADLGLQRAHPRGKLFAAIKGLQDAGISIPLAEDAVPPADRLTGAHTKGGEQYAKAKEKIINGA